MKRMSWIMGMILALCVMLAGCSGGTTAGGSEIIYNIGQYISGYHMLVVRAFSNNSNILSSDNSNILTYTW